MRFSPALLLKLGLIGCLALAITGCGGFTGVGLKTDFHSASGTVSSVQVSTVGGSGGSSVVVTFVTLQASGSSSQFTFCGDAASRFPLHTSVTVDFNPGQDCNVISAVILG